MRFIDSDLQAPHAAEARRKAFEDFVKEKARGRDTCSGPNGAVLCNCGFSDYFGPLSYERGMYQGRWIITDNKSNANVLVFRNKTEARDYAKTIREALKKNGYAQSDVYVDQVAIHSSRSVGFFASLAKSESYDYEDRYILRLRIRK